MIYGNAYSLNERVFNLKACPLVVTELSVVLHIVRQSLSFKSMNLCRSYFHLTHTFLFKTRAPASNQGRETSWVSKVNYALCIMSDQF